MLPGLLTTFGGRHSLVSQLLLDQDWPASSMIWTVEFMPDAVSGSGQQWWQYLAQSEFAAEGYVHSRARLWDETGKLVAISRQTVTVFA